MLETASSPLRLWGHGIALQAISLTRVYGEFLFRQQQAAEIVRGNEVATGNC
jgi:hypothetical protein